MRIRCSQNSVLTITCLTPAAAAWQEPLVLKLITTTFLSKLASEYSYRQCAMQRKTRSSLPTASVAGNRSHRRPIDKRCTWPRSYKWPCTKARKEQKKTIPKQRTQKVPTLSRRGCVRQL